MTKIPTVRLYHPDGGQIRVNLERADYFERNGWSDERPGPSTAEVKTKSRPNLKALSKNNSEGGSKDGED